MNRFTSIALAAFFLVSASFTASANTASNILPFDFNSIVRFDQAVSFVEETLEEEATIDFEIEELSELNKSIVFVTENGEETVSFDVNQKESDKVQNLLSAASFLMEANGSNYYMVKSL